ncbi:hypothetical protein BH10ACI3_BH10ACI3_13880 [soil metagenome]
MSNAVRLKNVFKAAVLLTAVMAFAASCIKQAGRAEVPLTAAETPDPITERVSSKTFQAFSHAIPEHKQFECASCHGREGKSTKLEYAGHESCVGCHLNQFTDRSLMDQTKVMCSICHEDLKANPPTMKTFPAKFVEGFNMKFDHSKHDNGKGRPAEGCAACHDPSGPGKTIPVGIQTHSNCYQCHTPDTKIGSCSTCHALGPYNRTLQSEYSFKAIFRHGDHSARQGVSCNECHTVVAGAPNSRQVTNISILQHQTRPGNNCLQCHNGRRAFTGNDPTNVSSCSRCHKGMASIPLPPNTFTEEAPPN